jgi:hypothetical protein
VRGLVRQFLFHALALAEVGEQLIPVTLPVAFMDVHRAARPRVWKAFGFRSMAGAAPTNVEKLDT